MEFTVKPIMVNFPDNSFTKYSPVPTFSGSSLKSTVK